MSDAYEDGVEEYYRLIMDGSTHAVYLATLAKSYNPEVSAKWLRRAVRGFTTVGQEHWVAGGHYHAGMLLHHLNQPGLAMDHFRQAQAAAPSWGAPRLYIEAERYRPRLITSSPSPTLVVHVGYPKAGSTWLQARFFPNLGCVNHLGSTFCEFLNGEDKVEGYYAVPSFRDSHACSLGSEEDYNEEEFPKVLTAQMNPAGVNTLSGEAFGHHPEQFALRLAGLRDKLGILVKVLMVGRRQRDIALSEYSQRVRIGQTDKELTDVVTWGEGPVPLSKYDYPKAVGAYRDALEPENVLFVPFEAMFSGDNAVLTEVCSFLGVEVNPVLLDTMLSRPRLNETRPKEKAWIDEKNPDKETFLNEIHEFFQESNRKLDKMLGGIGLDALGYY